MLVWALAASAPADPRTVTKYLLGLPVAPLTRVRLDRAFAAHQASKAGVAEPSRAE